MRPRWRVALSLAIVAVLLAALPQILPMLPMPRPRKQAAEPWRGVVNIWLCETWKPGSGSHAAWLRAQGKRFEKENAGVWIDVRIVEPSAAELAISMEDAQLPDVLVWGSGLLTSPQGTLLPIEAESTLKDAYRDAASYNEKVWALPLSAGGYAAIINKEAAVRAGVSQGAGLEELFAASYSYKAGKTTRKVYTAQVASNDYFNALPALLHGWEVDSASEFPPDLARSSDGWAEFALDRRTAVYFGTPYEAKRIGVLHSRNQAFDWEIITPEQQLCDLLLFGSLVSGHRTNAGENALQRADMAQQFLGFLLTPESQLALGDAGGMPVVDVGELYPASDAVLRQIERSLQNAVVPNAFEWASSVRAFNSGLGPSASAQQAISAAKVLLRQP